MSFTEANYENAVLELWATDIHTVPMFNGITPNRSIWMS